jgi:hypothetical protein
LGTELKSEYKEQSRDEWREGSGGEEEEKEKEGRAHRFVSKNRREEHVRTQGS